MRATGYIFTRGSRRPPARTGLCSLPTGVTDETWGRLPHLCSEMGGTWGGWAFGKGMGVCVRVQPGRQARARGASQGQRGARRSIMQCDWVRSRRAAGDGGPSLGGCGTWGSHSPGWLSFRSPALASKDADCGVAVGTPGSAAAARTQPWPGGGSHRGECLTAVRAGLLRKLDRCRPSAGVVRGLPVGLGPGRVCPQAEPLWAGTGSVSPGEGSGRAGAPRGQNGDSPARPLPPSGTPPPPPFL